MSWMKYPPTVRVLLRNLDISSNSSETRGIWRCPKLTLALLTKWSLSRRLRQRSRRRQMATPRIPEIGNAVVGAADVGVVAGAANACQTRNLPVQRGKRNARRHSARNLQTVRNDQSGQNETTVRNETSVQSAAISAR